MAIDIYLGSPQPKQDEFLMATERYVSYGGSRGGGKSWALRFKLKALSFYNAGIRCLLVRRTYNELYTNHIEVLLKEIPPEVATYNDSKKTFTFCNGSILKLGYCDSERDVHQYQGQEYDIIAIDEATQLTEYQFQCFKGCLRGANKFPKRMYLTCNPGGVGHAWVKRLFLDRDFREGEDPEDYHFINASVYDNPALLENDENYVKELQSLPEDMRRAWLYGEWDVFDGQFFKEFNSGVHVCEPFIIPREWFRYRAFDYGLDMCACLWVAVDTEGNSYVYREFNSPNLIVSEAAKAILGNTPDDEIIRSTYAPPDLWSRQKDTGKSMFEVFRDNGLDIIKASNDRHSGWEQVKEHLKVYDTRDAISGEVVKKSKLVIFSNCRDLIKNIPLLQFDKHDPNDAATQPHDITHNTDALRYFCVSRMSYTPKPEPELTKAESFKRQMFGMDKKHIRRW